MDLTLVPERYSSSGNLLGIVRLPLDRDYRLWELIEGFQINTFPPGFVYTRYSDDGLEEETTDAYERPLTFVYAGSFLVLKDEVLYDLTQWNAATIRFLQKLPPGMRVLLWWH